MAGDWIKMRTDLASDPAVIDLAIALNVGEDLVVGKLHRFWAWVTTHFSEAILKPDNEAMRGWIDRYMGLPGFVDCMISVGWMSTVDGFLCVPHFDRHMSEGAKNRALRAEQQRSRRVVKSEAEMKPRDGFKEASRAEQRRAEKKQQSAVPNGTKGLLAKQRLSLDDLRDTARLVSVANQLGGAFTTSEGVRRVVGAAEHVLHQMKIKSIKTPVGMFCAIVAEGRWEDLTDVQLDKAHERVKRCEQGSTARPSEFARSVSDKFSGTDAAPDE